MDLYGSALYLMNRVYHHSVSVSVSVPHTNTLKLLGRYSVKRGFVSVILLQLTSTQEIAEKRGRMQRLEAHL